MSRKSPTASATLYKIGTKKTGNDGNTWIIVENKNGIKRWQLYKKSVKKEAKPNPDEELFVGEMYGTPLLKYSKTNMKHWMRKCSENQKNNILSIINKILPSIEKLGVKVYLLPIVLAEGNYFFVDTIWKIFEYGYPKTTYDDITSNTKSPFLYLLIHLNTDLTLFFDHFVGNYYLGCKNQEIEGFDIKKGNKIKEELMKILDIYYKNRPAWNGKTNKNIKFYF